MAQFKTSLLTLSKSLEETGSYGPLRQEIIDWVVKKEDEFEANPENIDYNPCFNAISKLLIDGELTLRVASLFRPLLIELVVRCTLMKLDLGTFSRIEVLISMFSKLLPSNPQLKQIFINFSRSSPSPLDQFTPDQETLDVYLNDRVNKASITRNLQSILCLLMNDSTLAKNWNLGPLFILVKSNDVQIAALAFKCLQLYSSLSESQARQLVTDDVYIASQMIIIQVLETLQKNILKSSETTIDWELSIFTKSLTTQVVNVGNVLLFKKNKALPEPAKLVPVATTFRNLQEIALALSMGAPVLLEGETGVGKTALIEEVARAVSKTDLVKIHLGDQTDSKALLGTYVATSTPGQFHWQIGVLTKAVKFGHWVLIEDIDLAPQEVISVMIPLLESRTLFILGRGEKIIAADGFQLFATRRTVPSSRASASAHDRQIAGGSFWTKVTVNPLNSDELVQVVSQRFTGLSALASQIIQVFSTMQYAYLRPEELKISAIRIGRPLTTRDLIKWCTRVSRLGPIQLPLSEEMREIFFSEAVDCFCGMLSDFETWATVLAVLGDALGLSSMKSQYYTTSHTPALEDGNDAMVRIGRVQLTRYSSARELQVIKSKNAQPFALTKHALRLMERISACVQLTEPVLLVGETGTGKTTVVQHLARLMNQKLIAVNLSQQSDSSDLLGGFTPVDGKALAFPLFETFLELFNATFNAEQNQKFIAKAQKFFNRGKWIKLVEMFNSAISKAGPVTTSSEPAAKQARTPSHELANEWAQFSKDVSNFGAQADKLDNKLMFNFIEGTLVKAVRQGHWVLLDEINLATTETLECLSGLLQDKQGSLLLTEKGDSDEIPRHPNFRVFACMNPATDVGKRDLPPGLRNRFTEFYVHSPDTVQEDLIAIVQGYLAGFIHGDDSSVMDVVEFYQAAKGLQRARKIADGANQTPHYSIRTLSRALSHVRHTVTTYGLRRALYEGFCMTFATQLTKEGCRTITDLVKTHLLRPVKNIAQCLNFVPPLTAGHNHVQFREDSFWLPRGPEPIDPLAHTRYVITPSVQENIDNLARVVMSSKYPVLIQGPTSSGKTSMVEYLANCTGHRFVRINNHEHTDLQEYVGSYVSKDGRLQFQEGALVTALRHGHWIVLDELNLAPSDVLEALNRLLDDNRELLISETQEVVKPHKNFMLFATQNPAGLYGGRKALSRAFRNRFLELHFDDIPGSELETILTTRCAIAPSYCKLLVQVYAKLQARRQTTRVFESKEGFITLRDLFRWANRQAAGKSELANHGFMLLAERVRKPEEKLIVKETLEEVIKVKIDIDSLYSCTSLPEFQAYTAISDTTIAWTKAMQRLFSLVTACLRNNESALLVGSTGCGKTTVCQMLASALNQTLRIVNCHQNTETSDLLGGQRPLRQQTAIRAQLHHDLSELLSPILGESCPTELEELQSKYETLYQNKPDSLLWKAADEQNLDLSHLQDLLSRCHQASSLFEWHDGPLVQSMKEGGMFLLDEISLAEDSVLERLNSVLEPARLLVLAEKGSEQVEQLTADTKFQFLATMNPGGDFGKKELSPALRNRFTEIWVPPVSDKDDLRCIIEEGLAVLPSEGRTNLASAMLGFLEWFVAAVSPKVATGASHQVVSLRDILSWTHFIVKTHLTLENEALAFIHGGCLVFLDGLGSNSSLATSSANDPRFADHLRRQGLEKLMHLSGQTVDARDFCHFGGEDIESSLIYTQSQIQHSPSAFMVGPFPITKGTTLSLKDGFALNAPTTFDNMRRVLRALQISKPVMLEGSPGVGKTSLIQAIADRAQRTLVRINLSEQTDLMDLFGTDLPVEGGRSGEFAWRDAPFLSAMRQGHWVLLDEINLASQSVLEGLNSCLDHRGSVFVPELGRAFDKAPDFQVFAAQNPLQQGGGRKGLPRSFLNRFAQVHVQPLSMGDLQVICRQAYPTLSPATTRQMLEFNNQLHEATMLLRRFGRQGSPWEFNLRDVFRWMDLLRTPLTQPQDFLDLVYLQRMRTPKDRHQVVELFQAVFGSTYDLLKPDYRLDADTLSVGRSHLTRIGCTLPVEEELQLFQTQLPALEAIMKCVEMNWLAILVGPQGAGKTSLLRGLAKLVGRPLIEFAMNPGVDTMELLGGFEQMEPARYRQVAKIKLFTLLEDISHQCFGQDSAKHLLLSQVAEIRRRLLNLEWDQVAASCLNKILHQLITIVPETMAIQSAILNAQQAVSDLAKLERSETGGRFEWVEGALIEAMENGHWFLIDNANLCHASVLDRLNPLLEPNGALMLHERGLGANGEMRWARPHKDFRIFLAMDPTHGELSRPMRNRGLEIVLPQAADWSSNPYDLHRLISINKFSPAQAARLIQTHNNALAPTGESQNLLPGAPRDFSFLCRWVAERVQRGSTFEASLDAASRTVYREPTNATESLDLPWIIPAAPTSLLSRDTALFNLLTQASCLVHLLNHPTGTAAWTSQVESAGLYFVMRVTPGDAELRQQFLVWLGSRIEPTTQINVFKHVLAALVQCPVINELRSVCTAFCVDHLNCQFPETMSPMDWIDSPVFYQAMLRSPTQVLDRFHSLKSKFQVAAALFTLECQLSVTTRHAESRMGSLSLLEQSYLSVQHGTVPEGVHGPLIQLFYPLILAIQTYLMDWILPDTEPQAKESVVIEVVGHMNSLLRTLNSEQVKFARLATLIKWISKSLTIDPSPPSQTVTVACSEILHRIGQDSHRAMKLIWKHLRYPVFPTTDLQYLKLEWVNALTRIDPYRSPGQLAFDPYTNSERHNMPTVVQALATLHLLEPSTSSYQAAVDSACSIVADAVSGFEAHALTRQDALITHLFAMVDHESALQETHLLARVMSAANGFQTNTTALLQEIEAWLGLNFQASSRNILDFASWQNISWILERHPLDQGMLRGFLIDQLLAWSQRIWCSSFNHVTLQLNEDHSEGMDGFAGPPRLYQSLKTATTLQLLASLNVFPLKSLRQHTNQIKKLSGTLHRQLGDNPLMDQSGLHLAAGLLIQMILSFSKHMLSDQAESIHGACQAFMTQLESISTGKWFLTLKSRNQALGLGKAASLVMELKNVLDTVTHPAVQDAIRSYASPALSLVHYFLTHHHQAAYNVYGKMWVYIGLGFLHTYIPKCPYDPVIKVQMKGELYRAKSLQTQAATQVQRAIQLNYNGSSTNVAIAQLESSLISTQSSLEKLTPLMIPRPETSQDSELFQDITYLLTNLTDPKALNSLMDELQSGAESNAMAKERTLQSNLEEFTRRIQFKYPLYPDLLRPIELALHHIRHGMRLCVYGSQHSESPYLEKFLGSMLSYPYNPDPHQSFMDEVSKDQVLCRIKAHFTNKLTPPKAKGYGFILVIMAQRHLVEAANKGWISPEDRTHLQSIFSEISALWNSVEDSRRREQREKESLFKSKVQAVEDVEDDESALIDKEMRELFPSYEDNFGQDDESPIVTNPVGSFKEVDPVWATEVASLHGMFANWLNQGQVTVHPITHAQKEHLLMRAYSAGADLIKDISRMPDWSLDIQLASSRALALHLGWESLSNPLGPSARAETIIDLVPYNFYHSPNTGEAQKILPVLNQLRSKIGSLLDQWPEHAVLVELDLMVHRISQFSCQSPLMKLLTGLELFLRKAQDWEAYASKQYSLSEPLKEVTLLIVQWRQLELGSWPTLLDSVLVAFTNSAHTWWLDLYNTVLANLSRENLLSDTLNALDRFIRSSNLGEFCPRIEMVRSFALHLKSQISNQGTDALVNLHRIIANLYDYYQQFAAPVREKVAMLRKPIEKELKDLVKIASWKDVNIDVLHQSAAKTHRALTRLSRKFRLHLASPVSVIFNEVQGNVMEPAFKLTPSKSDRNVRFSMILPDHALSTLPHAECKILAKFTQLYKKDVYPMNRSSRANPAALEAFMTDVLGQVAEFQKESVPDGKDERVAYIKSRRMVKKRALGDLWKQLKKLGLKYRSSLRREQTPLTIFQHPLPDLFDDAWTYSQSNIDSRHGHLYSFNQDWIKAQFYYQRILARLPHLKSCAHQPSPDISLAETERGLGYVEGICQLVQQQRTALGTMHPHLMKVSGILAHWTSMAQSQSVSLNLTTYQQLLSDKSILDTLSQWLGQATRVLNVNDPSSSLSKKLFGILTQVQGLIALTNSEISRVLVLPLACGITSQVSNPSMESIVQSNAAALTDLMHELSTLLAQYPKKAALLVSVVDHLGQHLKRIPQELTADPTFVQQHVSGIETKSQKVVEIIQVATQKMVKLSRTIRGVSSVEDGAVEEEKDEEDQFGMHPNQLTWTHQHYLALLQSLDLATISDLMTNIQTHLHQLSRADHPESSTAQPLMEMIPILHQYFLMARQLLWEFLASHKALCKLNYIVCNLSVTLFQQGFCLPQMDQEEGPAIDGQEGTGVGEGEGDKDVSEEIESEDQVSGTQNEKKSDHDQSQDEKDKAFEMEQDFDGEMEDIDQNEEEDKDESDEEESDKDEPDDQIADLENDEEAVDEKIWGDDGPEDENQDEPESQVGKDPKDTTQNQKEDDIVAKEDGLDDDQPSNQNETNEIEPPKQEPPKDDDPKNDEEDKEEEFEEQPESTKDNTKQPPTDAPPEGDNLDLPEDLELELDEDEKMDVSDDDDQAKDDDKEDENDDGEEMDEDGVKDNVDDGMEVDPEEKDQDLAEEGDATHAEIDSEKDDPEHQPEDGEEEDEKVQARSEEEPPEQFDPLNSQMTPLETPQNQNNANIPPPPSNETMGVSGESGQMAFESDGQPVPEDENQKPAGAEQNSQPGNPTAADNSKPTHDTQAKDEDKMEDEELFSKPNPNRALAEALNQWRQRLDAADPALEEMEDSPNENNLPIDDSADQKFEFIEKDDQAHDAEALGAATEEQFKSSLAIPEDSEYGPARTKAPEPITVESQAVSDWHLNDTIAGDDSAPGHFMEPLHHQDNHMDDADEPISQEEIDIEELRNELEQQLATWNQQQDGDKAQQSRELWARYDHLTHDLALNLCEQLRLILEPTLATKLQGDYRTGKRLNMKKIIPYIASQFKKDKIWLRRTKPSQRQYQIMIAVDDSKSMSESHSVQLTFESLALVTKALQQLEVGSTSVVSFGDKVRILHPFDAPFTQESGANLISQFTFAQTKTNLNALLGTTLQLFEHARHKSNRTDLWQLQLILSDGVCEDHEGLRAYLRKAEEQRIMVIFLIMDTKAKDTNSILNLQQVSYYTCPQTGEQKMRLAKYMNTFPFQYYLILNQIHLLPHVLADTLRQYFQLVQG